MSKPRPVQFVRMILPLLALIGFMAMAWNVTQAADPIFDDDAEVTEPVAAFTPADAEQPANAAPVAATAPPAIAEVAAIPDPPALPEDPVKNEPTPATKVTSAEPIANATKKDATTASESDGEMKETPSVAAADNEASDDEDAPSQTEVKSKTAVEEKPKVAEKSAEPSAPEMEKVGVAAASVGKVEKAKESLGQRREGDIGRNEELGYLQAKVTSQMLELEQRMYRLSEALKSLEPENASRLLIGLKYAREELIQFQMKEIQSALTTQNFRDAVVEQKQVLAKLQRLEQLLLSPDLDFQLQLERLRLMRELLKRLDDAIKEEEREKVATEKLLAKEKKLKELRERRPEEMDEKLEEEVKKLEAALAEEKFLSMRKDQANTRKTTEGISEAAVQLGDAGAAARSELIRATGSMTHAEQGLGGMSASTADPAQDEALASLKYARELLEAEAEKLLNRLRSEIKKRTLEGLAQMLEGQIAIRESTERLGPKAKEGARAVLTSIVSLATSEAKLIVIGEGLTSLVEETEFGIALPAALRSVTEAMTDVKERLGSADASEEVVAAEKLIEEDLQQLLEAMKQLPSQSDGKGGAGGGGNRERQLNRLIAELKMVRILQVRVNRDTKDVDQKRPAEVKDLTATIKNRIEAIHDRQEDVHDVTELISIERSEELQ
jgi:hypothetical protein